MQRCVTWWAACGEAALVEAAGSVEAVAEYRVPGNVGALDSVRTVKVHDAVAAEIATALHQTRATIGRRIDQARDLAGVMRPLRHAMAAGTVSVGHASAIREELGRLPIRDLDQHREQCATVLQDVLPYAAHRTPAQARKRTRALVAAIEPINSDDRRQRAARTHGVWVTDEGDDTSLLCSRMPTAHAHHAMAVINGLARDDRLRGAGDLGMDQRRVVALMSLLHHGSCGQNQSAESAAVELARVSAHVQVVVSADALGPALGAPAGTDLTTTGTRVE